MRNPSGVIVAAAVVMALPFGGSLGVLAAYLVAGKDFGQLPVGTVPLGIIAAIAFAVLPIVEATSRLKIMVAGTLIFIVFAWFAAQVGTSGGTMPLLESTGCPILIA